MQSRVQLLLISEPKSRFITRLFVLKRDRFGVGGRGPALGSVLSSTYPVWVLEEVHGRILPFSQRRLL
jgi:hypothetical protein